MKVGDLIHVPRYPYWGMGVVVEVGSAKEQEDCDLKIHWLDNNEVVWIMKEGLEKL
jgi:hypothetical protein|tara:strand:+ start:498 stop:665 length:168 start_codon:yes stop_codon:yes gene_type:complete